MLVALMLLGLQNWAWLGHFSNSITSVYQNNYDKTLAKASVKFANYLKGNGSEE